MADISVKGWFLDDDDDDDDDGGYITSEAK